jgi:hypothetical protein
MLTCFLNHTGPLPKFEGGEYPRNIQILRFLHEIEQSHDLADEETAQWVCANTAGRR